MADKTLSPGTLSLRFMQNARRAHNPPRRHPEQPHATDDAEWVLSPEIRKAWAQSAYHSEKAVTYEPSYLPFLFPSLHDTPATDASSSLSPPNALPPRGRRAFDKRGEEITHQASSSTTDITSQHNIDRHPTEQTKMARPHSISSPGLPSLTARLPNTANKDPSKDAKNAIFSRTRVGTDLRQSFSMQGAPFLRPAGVDAPADSPKTSNPPQSAIGATTASKQNMKRSRTSGDAGKPKKRTKPELIE